MNNNKGRNIGAADGDENTLLCIPLEKAREFEKRLPDYRLTAWIDREGLTGHWIFQFSPEDDHRAIEKLKTEFGLD